MRSTKVNGSDHGSRVRSEITAARVLALLFALSVFTTMLDHAAPTALPSPGPAAGIDQAGLASISRTLAWSRRPVRNGDRATSSPAMRNVELVLRDPRRQ